MLRIVSFELKDAIWIVGQYLPHVHTLALQKLGGVGQFLGREDVSRRHRNGVRIDVLNIGPTNADVSNLSGAINRLLRFSTPLPAKKLFDHFNASAVVTENEHL